MPVTTDLRHTADGDLLVFHCPGCGCDHGPRVSGSRPGPLWTWNGDRARPTLAPSIRVRGTVTLTPDEVARVMAGEKVEPRELLCHSFVRDGQIAFLSDCTHALAGQTVPLPEYEP